MVTRPEAFDTVLATNLHADILSDLASALTGSLGNGATANVNPNPAVPSMFEPIHGSAFDLVGTGLANPIGAFWTGALLLDHLGEAEAAARLMAAIEHVTETPRAPRIWAGRRELRISPKPCSRRSHRSRRDGVDCL